MIKTLDIYQSIYAVLEQSSDIAIKNKDLTDTVPPYFYIKFVSGTSKPTATDFFEEKMIFEILYFSAEKTAEDLLKQESLLKQLFSKPLKVEDDNKSIVYQEIDNITTTLNEDDYILNCRLEFNINQYISVDIINRYDEIDNDEYMDELEI